MSELLFRSHSPRNVVQARINSITDEISSMSASEILDISPEDIIEYLVDRWGINAVTTNEPGITVHHEEISVDASRNPRYDSFVVDGRYVPGARVTYYVPFTGDLELLRCQPSHSILPPLRATVRSSEIIFIYDRVEGQQSEVKDAFQRDLGQLLTHTRRVNAETADSNETITEFARRQLASKRQKSLKDQDFMKNIGYPLRVSKDSPLAPLIPDVKRRVAPQKPKASLESLRPGWEISTDIYEHILSVVSNMAIFMERSPRTFKCMDEESVRDLFLATLGSHYEGQNTSEAFNHEGRTDILIQAGDKNIFIAECKFWSGPKGLTGAIDQLLGYPAWRDTKTALLLFNRGRDMSTVVRKVTRTVKDHPNYKREERRSSETEFRYIFGHRDDMDLELILTILAFNVPA